jgi:post-segregation antitoxin (ccd killing protein)
LGTRINPSDRLEPRLRRLVQAERENRWIQENSAAIEAFNRRVAEHGLLSDEAGVDWSGRDV